MIEFGNECAIEYGPHSRIWIDMVFLVTAGMGHAEAALSLDLYKVQSDLSFVWWVWMYGSIGL